MNLKHMQKKQLGKLDYMSVAFECKALPGGEDPDFFYFEGYLSTYGNIDRGGDIVEKGCFDESLKEMRPDLLWQHNYGEVLGIFTDISSDEKGLFVKGKMPKDDSLVKGRVIPQMKVGSVRSMSIGYFVEESSYDEDNIRHIKKAVLVEGSLVSQPMNEKAEVTGMKSLSIEDAEKIKTKRELEDALRDLGVSQKAAVYLSSRFQEEEQQSESVDEVSEELKSQLEKLLTETKQLKEML